MGSSRWPCQANGAKTAGGLALLSGARTTSSKLSLPDDVSASTNTTFPTLNLLATLPDQSPILSEYNLDRTNK